MIVAAGTETEYRSQINTVLMADGKPMFAVWSIGHDGICGPMKKSTDGGLAWSDMLPTPENWRSLGSCPCIFRLTDMVGTKRFFVLAGRPKHYQSISLDGGRRHLLLVERGPQGGWPSGIACRTRGLYTERVDGLGHNPF